jgi:hypothetical protein
VVASEKILIAIEQDCVASRVAGRWDDQKVIIEADGVWPFNDALATVVRRAIVFVHYAGGAEVARELLVIGNVVAVCQEDCGDATHLMNLFSERFRETRGVDEHVSAFALRTDYEVAPPPKTRFGSEAAEVDILIHPIRKSFDASSGVILARRAD